MSRSPDLVQQMAGALKRGHPTAYCWGCWAQRLGVEQGAIREAAQQLSAAVQRSGLLPPQLLYLVYLRVAVINGYPF